MSKNSIKVDILNSIKQLMTLRGHLMLNSDITREIQRIYGIDVYSVRSIRYWVATARAAFDGEAVTDEESRVSSNHYIQKTEQTPVSLEELIEAEKARQSGTTEKTFDKQKGTGEIVYKGMSQITSEEEAIDFFEIDTEKYSIARIKLGSSSVTMKLKDWEIKKLNEKDRVLYKQTPITIVNYNSKVELVPRSKTAEELYQDMIDYIAIYSDPYTPEEVQSAENKQHAGVYGLADFHLGLTTDRFNVDILCDRLAQAAQHINRENHKENHIIINGDLLEAMAIMHDSQVFELDMEYVGTTGIRACFDIFNKFLFGRVTNLKGIYITAGNHDRTEGDKRRSNRFSSGAETFYHFCTDNIRGVGIRYHYTVLNVLIDGIGYLISHGDKKLVNDTSKFIQDYGFGDRADYHVVVTAHLHTRKTHKTMIKRPVIYEELLVVTQDTLNYRWIQLPSIVSSNEYATENGWSNGAGFVKMERAMTATGAWINNIKTTDIPLL